MCLGTKTMGANFSNHYERNVWSPPEIHIVLPFDLVLSLDQWTKNSEQKRWPQSPGRGTCLHILEAERWHQLRQSGEITVSSKRVWAGHPSSLQVPGVVNKKSSSFCFYTIKGIFKPDAAKLDGGVLVSL